MALRDNYQRWMHGWENRLATRDTNRVVRPLDYGLEWTRGWPIAASAVAAEADGDGVPQAEQVLAALNRRILAASDCFFGYRARSDYELTRQAGAELLHFTSATVSPYACNNRVRARWFPAPGRRAVVVLPQWNADAGSHNALCQILQALGIASLRLSMPYHDVRRPAETERADYAVSANVGRTIDAVRQAVVDVRCCVDWLEERGYRRFGVLGTSLGSCNAFVVAAHEPRLEACLFNHASTYFADVVWTGQATSHIRAGLERDITLDRLRPLWHAISPMCYFDQYARYERRSMIVYADYDLTFLPEFSRQILGEFGRRRLDIRHAVLPCGHYTTGQAPFKFMDAWQIGRFFASAF